jgi:hypothetical protein
MVGRSPEAAPFCKAVSVASNPHEMQNRRLSEANRQVKDALRDCHELLQRTQRLLRTMGQDNYPQR